MIDITRLFCDVSTSGDPIRYGTKKGIVGHGDVPPEGEHAIPKSAAERRPIVVWNFTNTCNLKCIHCYSDSYNKSYGEELSTEEAKKVIDDLAQFKVPAILFSGGEPLTRKDLFELAAYARAKGIRVVISTNGTLITPEVAKRIKEGGFVYVGISLDGIGAVNDRFRGVPGAFEKAMKGFRACVEIGQRVGLRLTLTRQTAQDLDGIFDFIEEEKINRACFYHLVYSGRGESLIQDDLSHQESRLAIDKIVKRTIDLHRRGKMVDILTVDNHVDNPYLYMKLKETDPDRAQEALRLMKWNGGGLYSSGVGIGNIDYRGHVHPDQFWQHYSLGDVRKRPFSDIWMDTEDPIMAGLKNRKPKLKGKCARCKWINICGGSFRVRADLYYKDPWEVDPACYLTEEEIAGEVI